LLVVAVSCKSKPEGDSSLTPRAEPAAVETRASALDQFPSKPGGGDVIENELPFMSDLTAYEATVIKAVKENTSPENLLKLAIILGGEVRDESQARPLIDRFNAFAEEAAPLVEREKDIWQKGFVLYEHFERRLLNNPAGERNAAHYQAGQYRPDVLLKNGKYNCYSSAVVFGLAAMHFGFEVQGVTMKEHAFVQIIKPGGNEAMEVETTNYGGYGKKHDRQFYKERQNKLSFEDYKKREVWPFLNFIVQAYKIRGDEAVTIPEDVKFRLVEIAGFLDQSMETQIDRLGAWHNKCGELVNAGRYDQALGLFKRVSNEMMSAYARKTDSAKFNETGAWTFALWSLSLAHTKPDEQVLQLSSIAMQMADRSLDSFSKIENNVELAVQHLIKNHLENNRDDQARAYLNAALSFIDCKETRDYLRKYTFATLGGKYFDSRQWENAINAYAQCKDIEDKSGKSVCRDNMETAFLNYAVDFHNKGDYEAAARIYQKCLETDPHCHRCEQRLAELKKRFRG